MILTEFPDLGWLKDQIRHGFASKRGWGGRILTNEGWPTVILNTQATTVKRDHIVGPLSLFTNLRGASSVDLDGRRANISPDFFFITNPGQSYSLEINQKEEPAKTFNIHFGEQFGDEVIASLSKQPQFLLEHPFEKPSLTLNLYNRLYPKDDFIRRIIDSLQPAPGDSIFEEEQLYKLLAHLLHQQGQLNEVKQKIPALKSSTREEIIRRLFNSSDYIYSFFDQDLSLEELAKVSCLSKFHFLRLFKIAFGETPHQFITKIRLQKAKELLRSGKLDVGTIAKVVGFENASSFSRLFYNRTGVYPSQFRD